MTSTEQARLREELFGEVCAQGLRFGLGDERLSHRRVIPRNDTWLIKMLCTSAVFDESRLERVETVCTAFIAAVRERRAERTLGKTGRGALSVRRLVGKRRNYDADPDTEMTDRPPGVDHPRMFVKGRTPVAYLADPYHIDEKEAREMADFAERWGLKFTNSGTPGLHYPGHVVSVLWKKK